MSWSGGVPVVLNGNADQGVCHNRVNPPQHHDGPGDLCSEAECWRDKDTMEEYEKGDFG